MVDRLFVTGYPRDEYKMNEIKDTYSCEWEPHPTLALFDLEVFCLFLLDNEFEERKMRMKGKRKQERKETEGRYEAKDISRKGGRTSKGEGRREGKTI